MKKVKALLIRIKSSIIILLKLHKLTTNVIILGKVRFDNKNINFGKKVYLYPNVTFRGSGKIEIGDNCAIGDNTIIYSSNGSYVKIGNDVSIAANCYIIDCNHGIEKNEIIRKQKLVCDPITIENDVWLGADVMVLKGVTIHKGAVIGAKSLVNKDISEYTVVGGCPCKLLKNRN